MQAEPPRCEQTEAKAGDPSEDDKRMIEQLDAAALGLAGVESDFDSWVHGDKRDGITLLAKARELCGKEAAKLREERDEANAIVRSWIAVIEEINGDGGPIPAIGNALVRGVVERIRQVTKERDELKHEAEELAKARDFNMREVEVWQKRAIGHKEEVAELKRKLAAVETAEPSGLPAVGETVAIVADPSRRRVAGHAFFVMGNAHDCFAERDEGKTWRRVVPAAQPIADGAPGVPEAATAETRARAMRARLREDLDACDKLLANINELCASEGSRDT